MKVFLNKQSYDIAENVSLQQFIDTLGIDTRNTAVAINNRLIVRNLWDTTKLHDEDNITIIVAAYGG